MYLLESLHQQLIGVIAWRLLQDISKYIIDMFIFYFEVVV